MLVAALLLVAVAAAVLVAGVVTGQTLLVQASIAGCLVAAVLLAVGVARSRPRRHAHGRVPAPTWSGASQASVTASSGGPSEGEPHPPAARADDDAS